MTQDLIKPIALDIDRVAHVLSLSVSTVEKLVREGAFPKPRHMSARRVCWLTQDVEAWAASRPISTLPPPPNTGAPKQRRAQHQVQA